MKLFVVFPFLALALVAAKSRASPKVFCVNKDKVIKDLKGQHGRPGSRGSEGEYGARGHEGILGFQGEMGPRGVTGPPGNKGEKGKNGQPGLTGLPGTPGIPGKRGEKGDPGPPGESGTDGEDGDPGDQGNNLPGEPGEPGLPGAEIKEDLLLSLLNDYYVLENDYYNELYHVTARELTDGRADTGGWGSSRSSSGSYIGASFVRPVYVTSVTVAGGLIPSWGTDTKEGFGSMELLYSNDEDYYEKAWHQAATIQTPVGEQLVTYNLTSPVTAKYWSLTSKENKWVGVTEFALKPLLNSE